MQTINPVLLKDLIQESCQILDKAEYLILKLTNDYSALRMQNPDDFNDLFKCFYLVLGTSGFIHLTNIFKIAREAVLLVGIFRDNQGTVPIQFSGELYSVCEVLKNGFVSAEKNLNDNEIENRVSEITKLLGKKHKIITRQLSQINGEQAYGVSI
jgi:chemotaxis protein histidine kinase CheA